MRIVALIGDGHTAVRINQRFKTVYPLRLYLFKDGLFVQAAASEYRDAVGARVVRIGNANTEQALRAVSEIAWRDNEMGMKALAPRLLVIPEILHGLRLSSDLQKAEFVVEKNGRQSKLELKPTAQLEKLSGGLPNRLKPGAPLRLPRSGSRIRTIISGSSTLPVPRAHVSKDVKKASSTFSSMLFKISHPPVIVLVKLWRLSSSEYLIT